MKQPSESDLEALIDRELRKLPELQAPASLVPRVMSVLERQARRPWWQRAWWEWPGLARWAASAVALAVLLICCGLPVLIGLMPGAGFGQASAWLHPGWQVWDHYQPLGKAMWTLGRSLATTPVMVAAACVSVGLYMLCIGVGSIFWRFLAQPSRAHLSYEN